MRFSEEWYQTHLLKKKLPRATAVKSNKKPASITLSPHAIALAALAKNPDLAKGNGEHYSQVRLFDFLERNHPDVYEMTHATPNGGYRTKATAGKLKAEGLKKGYPDISVDIPSQGFHGLRIEMKYGKGRMREEQSDWKGKLERHGYKFATCDSTEGAIQEITDYLQL